MYKLLLCFRYLRARYIALASIISVTLGVATLIVVNAVMLGFVTEMKARLHDNLSDIVISSRSLSGFPEPQRHLDYIWEHCGDDILAMTPAIRVPAMLTFRRGNEDENWPVELVGIDVETYGDVCGLKPFLQHPKNREKPNFDLKEDGYLVESDHGVYREDLEIAGWKYRREYVAYNQKMIAEFERERAALQHRMDEVSPSSSSPPSSSSSSFPAAAMGDLPAGFTDMTPPIPSLFEEDDSVSSPFLASSTTVTTTVTTSTSDDPFEQARLQNYSPIPESTVFDPEKQQHTGIFLGYALSNWARTLSDKERDKKGRLRKEDRLKIIPGDDISLTLPTAGNVPRGISDRFTVVDLFECNAMEFDRLVFAPLAAVQNLRGMIDPATGDTKVTQILVKVKPGVNEKVVRDKLADMFPAQFYVIETWQETQKVLLGAVYWEVAVLNVLLFLIIAVAGFGILAIFFMIVVEKTKDIGILKSLGASGSGVMQIFLCYSLSLGIVGSGLGTLLGLVMVWNIQAIVDMLTKLSGQQVFDPSIYMFYQVPTVVQPGMVAFVISVTILIAIAAGVFPALRAARMNPVESLRS